MTGPTIQDALQTIEQGNDGARTTTITRGGGTMDTKLTLLDGGAEWPEGSSIELLMKKPPDLCTDDELMRQIQVLEGRSRGLGKHVEELRAYIHEKFGE